MLPVFEEKVLVVAGEGWGINVEQCCSCCARLMKGRGGNWSLLSFARIAARANLLGVPQILRLAGPCVAAVRRSSLGLLPMQLAALHSLFDPERRDLEGRQPCGGRWRGALEDPKLKK